MNECVWTAYVISNSHVAVIDTQLFNIVHAVMHHNESTVCVWLFIESGYSCLRHGSACELDDLSAYWIENFLAPYNNQRLMLCTLSLAGCVGGCVNSQQWYIVSKVGVMNGASNMKIVT